MDKESKITIGLFIDSFYPMVDGVVMVVDNYAKLLSLKANVIVFAPGKRDRTYKDQFSYPLVRSKRVSIPFMEYDLSLPFFDRKFRKTLRNSHLDIVHIHSPFTISRSGISYAKKHHIPVVATLHSQYKKDFYERTKSQIVSDIAIKDITNTFNHCDECWAVNKKVAEIFKEYGINKEPKIQFNATDLIPVKDLGKVDLLKKKYKINEDEKVFLYVGRLDSVKNLAFTIQSLYRLKLKGIKFKMIFIGTGPFEPEMKQKIRKAGLTDYVFFPGKIMDRIELSNYYKLADLFLFPSLYDSSSLVQIEAASQKTPTVFIEGAATADTITNNVNGFISQDDSNLFAEKIIEILNNTKLYKKVANQAFKDLYQTWDEATDQAYKNYLRLIEEKNQK